MKTLPEGFENLINLNELYLSGSGVVTLHGHHYEAEKSDVIYQAYSKLHKRLRNLKKLERLHVEGFKLSRKSWQQKLLEIISEFPLLSDFTCGEVEDKDFRYAIIRWRRKSVLSRRLCSSLWPLIFQKAHRPLGIIDDIYDYDSVENTFCQDYRANGIAEYHLAHNCRPPEDNIFELLVEYGPKFLS